MNFTSGKYFVFNGRDSMWDKIMVVETEEDGRKSIFGHAKNILNENGFYKGYEDAEIELPLTIAKINQNGLETESFTNKELEDINKWLFLDDYKVLYIDGRVYNVIFTQGEVYSKNLTEKGYISLKAKLREPYSFGALKVDSRVAKGTYKFKVYNKSSANLKVYPEFIIDIKEPMTRISINNSNGLGLLIEDIPTSVKRIRIDNELRMIEADNGINLYKCLKRKWMELRSGKNTLTLDSDGKIEVQVKWQEKFNLQ
ncbi:MAG: hypothetical protein E6X82_03520 [Clostridium sp.]|nr:hypothetical protein [Clostridium sp.]